MYINKHKILSRHLKLWVWVGTGISLNDGVGMGLDGREK